MSEIRATTISDAAGTGPITLTKQSAAKAWLQYNTITTTSINDSFGVSSLTDNGGGDTTITFTSAFSNDDYGFAGATHNFHCAINTLSSTQAQSVGFYVSGTGGQRALYDIAEVGNIYHGDLA